MEESGWNGVHACWVAAVLFDCFQPHEPRPIRLLCLWHFPGKNTGGGHNALLHRIFSTQGSNHVSWVSCLAGRFFYCWATRAAPANRAAENIASRQWETGSLVLLLVTVIIILLFYWSIIHWTNLQRLNKYICTYLEICICLCYHHSDHNIDNFKGSDASLMPLPG